VKSTEGQGGPPDRWPHGGQQGQRWTSMGTSTESSVGTGTGTSVGSSAGTGTGSSTGSSTGTRAGHQHGHQSGHQHGHQNGHQHGKQSGHRHGHQHKHQTSMGTDTCIRPGPTLNNITTTHRAPKAYLRYIWDTSG